MSRSKIFGVVASVAGVFGAGAAVAAPEIEAGQQCGPCVAFGTAGPPAIVRNLNFTAPSRGTAAVTIAGTMQCVNNQSSGGFGFGVVDLSAQIVQGNPAPDASGPGGQRIAMRLAPNTNQLSSSINLAGTRIFDVSAGAQVFRFKMALNRMDAGTSCTIYNAQLSVIFVP